MMVKCKIWSGRCNGKNKASKCRHLNLEKENTTGFFVHFVSFPLLSFFFFLSCPHPLFFLSFFFLVNGFVKQNGGLIRPGFESHNLPCPRLTLYALDGPSGSHTMRVQWSAIALLLLSSGANIELEDAMVNEASIGSRLQEFLFEEDNLYSLGFHLVVHFFVSLFLFV